MSVIATEERLGDLVARHALARPDSRAVTDPTAELNYADFALRIEGLAAALAQDGIARGSTVAAWLPNSVDYLAAIFAVARRGAILVHINTRYGDAELGDILERTGASVLITRIGFEPVDFLEIFRNVPRDRLRNLKTIHLAGIGPCPPEIDGIATTHLSYVGKVAESASPDDICLTYTTSGTTSRPKLVAHSQRSISRHAHDVARRVDLGRRGATLLAAAPFCGTFGNIAAMAAIAGGARVICMDSFEPEAADRLIRNHGVTHLVGDDRMLGRLAHAALEGAGPHQGVVFFGVAAFHPDAETSCRLGVEAGLKPHAIYGSSEVQALFAIGSPENGGFGLVWPTSADARFRIAGEAEGSNGSRGELLVSGPSVFDGYLENPSERPERPFDGLFRTGDLAEAHGEGFSYEGRLGDTLRLGGFLVAPGEIEAFLQAQPGVQAAAVVGADRNGGACAVAFVIPTASDATSEDELLSLCRTHLARYKTPARIAFVEQFPYSEGPNGPKISRAILRRNALDMLNLATADMHVGQAVA